MSAEYPTTIYATLISGGWITNWPSAPPPVTISSISNRSYDNDSTLLAISSAGRLYACGYPGGGWVADWPKASPEPFVYTAAGKSYVFGLTRGGTLYAIGLPNGGWVKNWPSAQPVLFRRVICNSQYIFALSTSNTGGEHSLFATAYPSGGWVRDWPKAPPVPLVEIAANDQYLIGLDASGRLYATAINGGWVTDWPTPQPRMFTRVAIHSVPDATYVMGVTSEGFGYFTALNGGWIRNFPHQQPKRIMDIVGSKTNKPDSYLFSLTQTVPASSLLDTGDFLIMKVYTGEVISYDTQTRLLQAKTTNSGTLIVEKIDADWFRIKSADNKYLTTSNGQLLVNGTQENASKLRLIVLPSGLFNIEFDNGDILQLQAKGSSALIRSPIYNTGTILDGNIVKNTMPHMQLMESSAVDISPCESAYAQLFWQLTGGFIIAIGLGSYCVNGQVAPGLWAILSSNQAFRATMTTIVNALRNLDPKAIVSASSATLGAIGTLWSQGYLWTAVKFVLTTAGWTAVTWILAKLIALVVAPELVAAQVLASTAVWTIQVISSAVTVATTCGMGEASPIHVAQIEAPKCWTCLDGGDECEKCKRKSNRNE